MSEAMRRALAQLAIEIEQLKFKYIEAERMNDVDKMESLINELEVLEAYYNHQAAILNGDALSSLNQSQEDVFIQSIQNDTFNTSSPSVCNTTEFDGFSAKWQKLLHQVKANKQPNSKMGFCYICLCDVQEDELLTLPCGHSLCLGECGERLPTPYCPSGGCNKRIDEVFATYESKPQGLKRKASDEAFNDRMTELRARGFVAAPAPSALLNDAAIQTPSVFPLVPEIIVVDDDGDNCDHDDDDEVVFVECRKP